MLRHAVLSLACGTLFAQTAPRPSFEVASIKPVANCAGMRGFQSGSPGRVTLTCVSVRSLARMAFGAFSGESLNTRMLEVTGGPAWIDSELYDITAKAEGAASIPQMLGPMLQSLLEDRFQLRAHRESKETPAFALTVAKGGPKLQPAKEGGCIPIDLNHPTRPQFKPGEAPPRYCGGGMTKSTGSTLHAEWYGVTMDEFAGRMLSNVAGRPVVNQTGLTGRYDIAVDYVSDMNLTAASRLNGETPAQIPAAPADSAGPTIFTAVQEQLGLKLAPAKTTAEVLVIDSAERPSQN